MGIKHIRKLNAIILILLLVISSILPISNTINVRADEKIDYIFIGDSRFVGMANAQGVSNTKTTSSGGNGTQVITQSGNIYWCAEVGTSIGGFKSQADEAIKKGKKGSTVIIYGLGVNNVSGVASDIEYCNKLASDGWTVYYCDLLPTTSKSSISEDSVKEANKKIYDGAGKYKVIKYHDSCDTKNSTDGTHYNADEYKKWYNNIISQAKGSSNGGTTTTDTSAEFKNALKDCLGYEPSDKEIYNYSYMISMFKTDGLNDIAIAGILGNILHEGSNIYAIEGHYGSQETEEGVQNYTEFEDGKTYHFKTKGYILTLKSGGKIVGMGHGVIQWSNENADNLFKFAQEKSKELGFTYVSVYHYFLKTYGGHQMDEWAWAYIPDIVGQMLFMITEYQPYISVKEKLNACTTPEDAAKIFCDDCEKPASPNYTERGGSAKTALKMVQVHKGTVGDANDQIDGVDEDVDEKIGTYMVQMGFYSEKDLESYCKLNELNFTDMLAEASRDNLSQDDLDTVKAWEDNITTHPVLNAFRVTIMVLGILLTVWAIFFYLAYWLQRVNNFVDIEFISLLSLGKFQMADEETNSNYGGLTKNAENGKTLVNHKAVIKICLVTLFLGVMLITGLIYNFVLWIIQLVTGTLHK